jgi:hypothetical protein
MVKGALMPRTSENLPTHAEVLVEIERVKAGLATSSDETRRRHLEEDLEFFEGIRVEIEIEALAAEHALASTN